MTHTPAVDSLEQVVALTDGTVVPFWVVAEMQAIAAWFKAHGCEDWHIAGIGPLNVRTGGTNAFTRPPGGSERLRESLRDMLELRAATMCSQVHPRGEVAIVNEAKAALASPQGAEQRQEGQ